MYVIRDPLTPAINSHKNALAFKNTIMRYFPRTTVNGVDTFGRLILWQRGIGVHKDTAHRKLYHVLGMKIKDMEKQSYSGLDYTYLYVKAYTAPNGTVSQNDIRNYIVEYSPMIYPNSIDPFNPDPVANTNLNPDPNKGTDDAYWDKDGWITVVLTYQPTQEHLINNTITDNEILQKVRNISPTEVFYDPHINSRLTALAIADLNMNTVFQTKLRVMSRSTATKDQILRARNIGKSSGVVVTQIRYVVSATVELKFRRTAAVQLPLALPSNVTSYLASVESMIDNLASVSNIASAFKFANKKSIDASRDFSASINQQLVVLSNWKNPYVDSDMTLVVDPSNVNSYYALADQTLIKIDGLRDLPPKQFQKTFLSLMKFDYKKRKKKGHWYDAVVSIVISVVAIVAAIALAATGNFVGAALALSLGAMTEGVWAMYLAKNGGGEGAIHTTMGMSEILGIAALVAGITAIYNQWATKTALQLAEDQAKQTVIDAVESGASQTTIDASASALSQAYEANAAVSSIGSLIGQAASQVTALGNKLGLIKNDMIGQVIGAASGGYDFLASSTTQLSEVTLQGVQDNIKEGITKFLSKPLSEITNQVVNWINAGFNAYVALIAPANEGLADKMSQLEKLEKEVENTSPDNMDNTWTAYTDPYGNIFEVGDQFDKTYIMLTSGKNRSLMNQCYDSGWRI